MYALQLGPPRTTTLDGSWRLPLLLFHFDLAISLDSCCTLVSAGVAVRPQHTLHSTTSADLHLPRLPLSTMPVPSLPVEIIEHVIKLSLPPLLFSTFKKRYSYLKRYSLVDSTWRELAQRELWREVLLTRSSSSQVKRAISQVHPQSLHGVWLEDYHGRDLLDLRKAGIHPRRIAAWSGELDPSLWGFFSGM